MGFIVSHPSVYQCATCKRLGVRLYRDYGYLETDKVTCKTCTIVRQTEHIKKYYGQKDKHGGYNEHDWERLMDQVLDKERYGVIDCPAFFPDPLPHGPDWTLAKEYDTWSNPPPHCVAWWFSLPE